MDTSIAGPSSQPARWRWLVPRHKAFRPRRKPARKHFSGRHHHNPIVGETDVFPVRRIYCIGRNYAAHSREMGSDPTREPPFFFQKPTDAIQNVAIGTVADHPYPCSPRTITMRSSWWRR